MKIKYKSLLFLLLPILASLALIAIIYYPVFFKGYWAINISDALNIHLPDNYNMVKTFCSGQLSLWNPNFNLGQPILDGGFHPGLIFYFLFNPFLANTVEILLGLFLAFLGIWYFLRQQHLEIFPAAVGSILYVLAGPVFFLHSYHLIFMAILLLPWILWVFHSYDQTKHPAWLWISAFLCILAAQSIEPDTLFYMYIGLFVDRLACFPMKQRRIYAVTWIIILLLSGLTALLSWLPLYEWLSHSSRATKCYNGVFKSSLSQLFIPMFTAYGENDNFYFYFGPAFAWLVMAGLTKFNKAIYISRYFLYILVIPICYVMLRFLYLLHPNSLGSIDIWRCMFVFCLGLAMMAAVGVSNILKGQHLERKLAFLIILLTLLLDIWAFRSRMFELRVIVVLLIASAGISLTILPLTKKTILFRMVGILIAVVVTSGVSAMAYITKERFCIISRKSRDIQKLSFYCDLAKTLKSGEGNGRITIFGRTDNTTSLIGIKALPNYSYIYNKDMESILYSDGLIELNDELPYWMRFYNPEAKALSFYGVRFLVTFGDLLSEKVKAGWVERPDFSWWLYRVWENKDYIGRAYIVTSSGKRRAGVEFIEDTPTSVAMRTKTEEGDRLVLADLNYPGWQAWVDGVSVSTESYHGCLRSVKLSKGIHLVRWSYSGNIQRLGMVLSIIALFSLISFLIILSFSKKLHK